MDVDANISPQHIDPVAVLRQTGEQLPTELLHRILALGKTAVEPLIEILVDEDLGCEDAPGEGWPPIHAVDLLVEMEAVEAIEPMLRVLAATTWDEVIHDRIVLRLPKLGPAVLEPALARIEPRMAPDLHDAICSVLAKLGVRDERVYAEYPERGPRSSRNRDERAGSRG